MVTSSPFRITLHSRAFARLGTIGDPQSVTIYPRHNQQPTGQIFVRSDHHRIPNLTTKGCRVTVDYYGQQILSGPVESLSGDIAPAGQVGIQIQDDWGLLNQMLGWQVPTAGIGAQNTAAYNTITNQPAETVVKTFAQRAITRLGLPVTVAPDLGRGATIPLMQMRMDALADKFLPVIDQAGIGVSIRQVGSGLVLDVYEPAWYPRNLTRKSGVVTEAQWSSAAPKFTRVVVGGQGDLTAREFRLVVDSAAEALWGIKREGFLDATDVDLGDLDILDDRGAAFLLENAATSGLKLTLSETDTFRYGETLRVGDLVTTELTAGGLPVTDVIREAVINWNVDEGLTATPVVGERTDEPNRAVAKALFKTAQKLRAINTRK